MRCGVDHRRGSNLMLLWLCNRPVVVVPLGPLAWEPPYAAGMALKSKKTKTKQNTSEATEWLRVMNLTNIQEDTVSIPRPIQWVEDPPLP